jgi:hypothetical protein
MGRGTYCSNQCTYLDRRHLMAQPDNAWCAICGTGFRVKPSRLVIGKGICCSRACRAAWLAREPLWERIWRRVDYGGRGCWPWTGAKDQDGYGSFQFAGQHCRATREIWRLIHGVYPTLAGHHCDSPSCRRPSHLYDATPQSNMDDMHRRGRARPVWSGVYGERSGAAKLTEDQVRAIRRRYAAGDVTQTALAREYGIRQATVSAIVLNRVWKRTV